MKRVLLTGAGGSIGVHVIAHLMHNTDWHIVCLDSFRHKGEFDRITRVCRNHPDWPARLTVIAHDLVAPLSKRQVKTIGSIDYIINLASLSDVQASIDDPVPFVMNNTAIIINMLEYARDIWNLRGDNHTPPPGTAFLHFSTDEVYGPAAIDSGHPEWDTILPSNPYAASKAAQECYGISYWRSYGVPLIITNTMNNFGEMQQSSKYPVIVQKKVESGESVTVHAAADGQIGTRYYLHSRNAADAVLFILRNCEPELHRPGWADMPSRYNIVGDKQLSNLELAQAIAGLMDKELKYELVDFHSKQPGHDLHYGLDGSKLSKLGWKAPMSFEESMKNTIEWQTRNKEWMG